MKAFSFTLLILLAVVLSCKKDNTLVADYEVSFNGQFQIELVSNPSTGNSWRWTNEKSVLIVEKISWSFIPGSPNAPGTAGKEIWIFKGVRRGIDTIVLEYSRGLDTDSAPADIKVLVVEVKP